MNDVKNYQINGTSVYEFVDRLDKELAGEDFNKVIDMMGKKIIDQNAYIDLLSYLVTSLEVDTDQRANALNIIYTKLSMFKD